VYTPVQDCLWIFYSCWRVFVMWVVGACPTTGAWPVRWAWPIILVGFHYGEILSIQKVVGNFARNYRVILPCSSLNHNFIHVRKMKKVWHGKVKHCDHVIYSRLIERRVKLWSKTFSKTCWVNIFSIFWFLKSWLIF